MDSQKMHAPPDAKSTTRAPPAGQRVDLSDPRCRERKPRFQSWDSDDNSSNNKKRKVLSSEGESGERHDSSSLSSFMTYSNFTMSCSGAETQEDNAPSTSGCSSFMAHKDKKRASKAERRERMKQYLKELKSMVQPDGRGGTLSALQQVLTNMRKMKADALKPTAPEKKAEQPSDTAISSHYALTQTVYDSMSHESLTSDALKYSDEILIYLTASDNVVRAVSQNLKTVLGYQWDRWVGRSLDDFVHKYDIVTYKSIIKRSEESLLDSSDGEFASEKQKIFYIRLRECKSLNTTGFSLRKQEKFLPFQCSFIRKKMCKREMQAEANQSDEISSSGYSGSLMQWGGSSRESGSKSGSDSDTWYTILHCTPLVSPYTDPMRLPDVTSFETRQTLFCSFCHIEPNTIALLGYLPQEIVGVSIFEFFHNDDLGRLFTIYQKVIALQGVPYKSGTIRLLAKNGCWLSCVTEWSSFVNPWSKRLEFVIGKHTIVKGPENVDIFSERFTRPSVEETPHEVLLARQKIKNLLLQPVETIYLGEEHETSQRPRHTVAIAENIDIVSTAMSSEAAAEAAATFKKDTMMSCDPEKQALHGTGILFRENAISRAYEQLSYTSCIKKFLLSQPQGFSSDSEVRKSSSEDGFDDDSVAINLSAGKPIGKWIKASIDDMVYNKRVKVPRLSDETRSLPSLNDAFWKNATIFSRDEYEFDISVPKPPSFGSSTKVLVSEQEHRDLENLPDPVVTRDQLKLQQPPTPTTETPQTEAGRSPVMHLTRESLLRHTLMQEQLYLASASPERNVLFMNECRDIESPVSNGRRNTLKRMHSPEMNFNQCKSGRNNEGQRIITPTSILNPVFPLHTFDSKDSFRSLVRVKQMVVPMQMYPIVSRSVTQFRGGQQLPPGITTSSGMTFRQGEMMGFQTTDSSPRVTNVGLPIPVHQLNSYLMQQGNMYMPKLSTRPMRKLPQKSKLPVWTTSDTSSTEETLSSFYILESSGQPTRQYNEMVLQSLARQMSDPQQKGLDPAPWLQLVNFSDSMQYRYQLQCSKKQVLSEAFMEELAKMSQPISVLEQIDEVLDGADGLPIIDQEHDYLMFNSEQHAPCVCIVNTCCNRWNTEDHGIADMFKRMCKKGNKKKEKHMKKSLKSKVTHKDAAMQTDFSFKMEMDEEAENETEADIGARDGMLIDIQVNGILVKSTKSDSCSNKSEDMFIRCDMSMDSRNSLNTSDITPSDQRSNNENGSSLKESDGDAMSKKSDSSSSDKQVISSESESDTKTSVMDEFYSSLFIDLNVCFPQCHSDMVPWLVDVDFDDNLQLNYHMESKDSELILQRDRTRIEAMGEPNLVRTQLCALMEDLSSNMDISSMIVGSEAGSFMTDNLSLME